MPYAQPGSSWLFILMRALLRGKPSSCVSRQLSLLLQLPGVPAYAPATAVLAELVPIVLPPAPVPVPVAAAAVPSVAPPGKAYQELAT